MSKIKASTRLLSILGKPVKHSMSPYMHNLSFERLNLDFAYMAFEIKDDELGKAVEAMKTLDAKGFNITMPYKKEVMKFLDEIDEEAEIIGSVNTVLNDGGKLIGYNTDGKGFIKSLEQNNINFKGEKIIIVGAGGAARAIAIQLAIESAGEIVIANRTIKNAELISDTINHNISGTRSRSILLDQVVLKEELKDAKILINTTSIGMKETIDKSIIENDNILHKDLFVADIIYDPPKTKLLLQAENIGCRTMNGLSMLIYQGAIAFKIWTRHDMPQSVIEDMLKR